MKHWLALIGVILCCSVGFATQNGKNEPIFTSVDLMNHCSGASAERQLCMAYMRGFSDGNRWLVYDHPSVVVNPKDSVCIPNRESIESAVELFVARFRGREDELQTLSPFRALAIALSSRYSCEKLFDPMPAVGR